jgi:hypothetical protein
MRETDLYLPVKILFEDLGYEVGAEVGDIDVLATKEEEFIVIELKKELNLRLITQGALRQKMSKVVYVAVPKPSYKVRTSKRFMEKVYLLKRLGIGLIFVNFKNSGAIAMIVEDSTIFDLKHSQSLNKRTRERALKEKSLRSGDYNMGGQKGSKITAYKENVLLIVGLLSLNDMMKVSEIRAIAGEKSGSILQKNYYGYFNRAKVGYYELTEAGYEAVVAYNYIIEKLI